MVIVLLCIVVKVWLLCCCYSVVIVLLCIVVIVWLLCCCVLLLKCGYCVVVYYCYGVVIVLLCIAVIEWVLYCCVGLDLYRVGHEQWILFVHTYEYSWMYLVIAFILWSSSNLLNNSEFNHNKPGATVSTLNSFYLIKLMFLSFWSSSFWARSSPILGGHLLFLLHIEISF